jgi:ectoine hydroxylase-related dioxygenase (phytanoyl-CoA dioxygenase family)
MHGERFYGGQAPAPVDDPLSYHIEALGSLGYTVVEDVLPEGDLVEWRERIDAVYELQQQEMGGREALVAIADQDICRAPLLYDQAFLSMARHEKVLAIVRRLLGEWVILNLQNAIINRPGERHQQSAWHRDLPYQNWVSSRPLAIGALFAIDPFSELTGSTLVLAHSHRRESIPSQAYISAHAASISASPGSVLLFDAMLFHRAGYNASQQIRRGVNHLYTVPILKQQYDFPQALGDLFHEDAELRRLLGYTSRVPVNVAQWRAERRDRKAGGAATDAKN